MSESPSDSTEAQGTDDPGTTPRSAADSLDAAFEVLVAERRRRVLYALYRRGGPVALATLAEEIASHEDTEGERVAASLHHVHLPKLSATNVVEYDSEDGTVRLLDDCEQLYRHLSAAAEEEHRPLGRPAENATLSDF
jgi:hypothetical protein